MSSPRPADRIMQRLRYLVFHVSLRKEHIWLIDGKVWIWIMNVKLSRNGKSCLQICTLIKNWEKMQYEQQLTINFVTFVLARCSLRYGSISWKLQSVNSSAIIPSTFWEKTGPYFPCRKKEMPILLQIFSVQYSFLVCQCPSTATE